MSLLIEDGGNTELSDHTRGFVGDTENSVVIVLDSNKKRRYRRSVTKKPTHGLRAILPEHLQAAFELARVNRGVSQGKMAHDIGCRQQTISHVLLGDTKEGGWKWPIIRYLAPELWEIAIERNLLPLRKELHELGLQPKSDNVMTAVRDEASQYTFNLYEPALARGGDVMLFPAQPTAKILPPNFVHSDKAYAVQMVGNSMLPRFQHGEILDIDPELATEVATIASF